MKSSVKNRNRSRKFLSTVAMVGLFVLASAPRVFADDDDCQRRIVKVDHKLHEAIEHHGYESKQADRYRHELHEARERCWNEHHHWWDEHGHSWRTDRDWDDHDHDHH